MGRGARVRRTVRRFRRIAPAVSWRDEVEVIYTIHYTDPRCLDLAGVTFAFDASQIAVLKVRLERDGYVVTDVTPKTPIAGR
jgi:hypothetical protein